MKTLSALTVFLLFALFAQGQENRFMDYRDSAEYSYTTFEGLKWMKENMSIQIANDFCSQNTESERACALGNFYSHKHTDQVCPKDWRLPTTKEWLKYFESLKIDHSNKKYFKTDLSNGMFMVVDKKKKKDFLPKDHPLKIETTGWVQGEKWVNIKQTTFWAIEETTQNETTHVHIGHHAFVIHWHSHHIYDKPKKVRKFPVRCVSEM